MLARGVSYGMTLNIRFDNEYSQYQANIYKEILPQATATPRPLFIGYRRSHYTRP